MSQVKIQNVNGYLCQMSRSWVSNLIVGQWENQQSSIQPQALRDKQEDNTSAIMKELVKYEVMSGLYLCDMCSACIPYSIEGQVEWHKVLVSRSGCWESRPNQTSALISYPVIS